MKPFKPEHYYRAALERMRQAQILYRQDSCFTLAMYVAGVAIECLLRAFKGRRDPSFDEKHDLLRLFKASGILRKSTGESYDLADPTPRLLLKWINEIVVLWSNDYRFASEERLRSHLRKNVAFRRITKGDLLKASARQLIEACQKFMDRGVFLWQKS